MPIKIIKRPAPAPEPAPVVADALAVPGKVLDGMCAAAIGPAPNAIVPWWLMASYLYYHHDVSLLSDAYYDKLARDMASTWDALEHPHKHLIGTEDLKAGSLYGLELARYPLSTRYAAAVLARSEFDVVIDVRSEPVQLIAHDVEAQGESA
jgi:hypothetical protein